MVMKLKSSFQKKEHLPSDHIGCHHKVLGAGARETEVKDLEGAIMLHRNVIGFEVAVNDARHMEVL